MTSSFLEAPLAAVSGIGPNVLKRLSRLGLHTVRDLLWHFPARYEDYSELMTIAALGPNMHTTVNAEVQSITTRRAWRKNLSVTEAALADDTGSVRAVWFNQPYLETTLTPGTRGSFAGKTSVKNGEVYFSNPTFERTTGRTTHTKHTARLVPVYPETKGLTSKWLRHLILPILGRLPALDDPLPERLREEHRYPALAQALHAVHFPATPGEASHARERFVFEELFTLQLYTLLERASLAKESAPPLPFPPDRMKQLIAALPFTLTASQKKALWEIMQDMGDEHPMNRLLQGDVGSGKTIVAVLASLIAHANGYQTAFMAPTEVLARQHFRTYQKLYACLESVIDLPRVGLIARGGGQVLHADGLTGAASITGVRQQVAEERIGVCIGTHALLYGEDKRGGTKATPGAAFPELGLVIIDEQHRFGVKQRKALVTRGREVPHFLSMSATPIPRTIMMTVFGDLTTSRITELPKDRKTIATKIVGPHDRKAAYALVRKEVDKGRQAFVICPRIDPPAGDMPAEERARQRYIQKLDAKSVKEEYERLRKDIFPKLRLGMLYGGMPAREKELVMDRFRDETIDILVATSVIEVGVDVPNATVMLIENADHFGLAQLYQFRGRVGRGEHQSYCLLFTESASKTAEARLRAIVGAKNGFELAEQDLKLRGPGEFLGNAQTGMPDLAMRHLSNEPLVKKSRETAISVLKSDPVLKDHPLLQTQLAAFRKRVHRE